jgi:deoxyribodipyrimidine photo-lyase
LRNLSIKQTMRYNVVWFKRDLRLQDHAALYHAANNGRVLCLYVIEPLLWSEQDAGLQHYQFLLESLREVDSALKSLGGKLHIVTGDATGVLDRLFQSAPFENLYSHEETGNGISYQRDRAVTKWCRERGVTWHQYAQFGVVRRLKTRNFWQAKWEAHVNAAIFPSPEITKLQFISLPWNEPAPATASSLKLNAHAPPRRQLGGRREGLSVLDSFLNDRCAQYRGGISSPLSAPSACSRLSPYLAFGCISLREVVQATRSQIARQPNTQSRHKQGMTAFMSRLYWHCHFMQKLESEPALEFHNLHRGYDNLREQEFNPLHFEALINARTGWPMVDACVVMLRETGWLNFRMRAMLVSVAAYPLWLHWRPVGLWLARQFLDYEPGIHWSQMQMQSGTTGINTARIYNPIKQARDHDPRGQFVRRWLPAMRRVPDTWLFEPWRMPADIQASCGVIVGVDIATPLVDLDAATRTAKQRLYVLRSKPEVRSAKAAIVEKHGSRKRTVARKKAKPIDTQLKLEF